MNQQSPFSTFRVEKHAGEYKDFGNSADDPYPLTGVTYPVDYGDIEGYLGEDGANLDVFMGRDGTILGFFTVMRPELEEGEHKFYVNLTEDEEKAVLKEFEPVVLEHGRFQSMNELIAAIQPFQIEP
jgi:hypothetical protein